MTPTLTRAAVRELDRRAIHEFGVPGLVLMENAGRGVAELLLRLNTDRRPVVILCGKGNNGGDGFVIARHLDNREVPVRVVLFADPAQLTDDAAVMYGIAVRSGLPIIAVTADDVTDAWLAATLPTGADAWVVDALFGTGLDRPLGEPFGKVIAALNAGTAPVLAVDVPSGLDCDTGQPLGPCVRATQTATFVAMKAGFTAAYAASWLGRVHLIDIGAPRILLEQSVRGSVA